MKWEYCQVYYQNDDTYAAFDGNSICDGDSILIRLLNRLGEDRWEYCGCVMGDTDKPYHLLKRSLP